MLCSGPAKSREAFGDHVSHIGIGTNEIFGGSLVITALDP